MYANDTKGVRALFVWLLEHLPKASAEVGGGAGPSGSAAGGPGGVGASTADAFRRSLHAELAQMARRTWVRPAARSRSVRQEGAADVHRLRTTPLFYPAKTKRENEAARAYFARFMPLVTLQPPAVHAIPASVLEDNLSDVTLQRERDHEWETAGLVSGKDQRKYWKDKQAGIDRKMASILRATLRNSRRTATVDDVASASGPGAKGGEAGRSRFAHQAAFEKNAPDGPKAQTEEEKEAARAAALAALREERDGIEAALNARKEALAGFRRDVQGMEQRFRTESARTGELEAMYKFEKRVFTMLERGEETVLELEAAVQALQSELRRLAVEWEKTRVDKITEIRRLRAGEGDRMDASKDKMADIKRMREQMAELIEENHDVTARYQAVLAEFRGLPQNVNRADYTVRILDIVHQVSKQKVDISNVLRDTRELQKEINTVTEHLGRTWKMTDEMIFEDAKKDTHCRSAYRLLASLHQARLGEVAGASVCLCLSVCLSGCVCLSLSACDVCLRCLSVSCL